MVRNDPIDDKLAIFRQQASIMSAKKEDIANKLQKAMENLSTHENESKRKTALLDSLKASGTVMKGDEVSNIHLLSVNRYVSVNAMLLNLTDLFILTFFYLFVLSLKRMLINCGVRATYIRKSAKM